MATTTAGRHSRIASEEDPDVVPSSADEGGDEAEREQGAQQAGGTSPALPSASLPPTTGAGTGTGGAAGASKRTSTRLRTAGQGASTTTGGGAGAAGDGAGGGLYESMRGLTSPMNSLFRLNPSEHQQRKAQALDVLTDMMAVPEDSSPTSAGGVGVKGFDPNRWVIAAGVLEKRRDGRMREGYAKRVFVLGRDTLYYYLLPQQDNQGFMPLLGDERGQIRLVDVQDVTTGQDKDHIYLTVTVAQVKKRSASGILSLPVSSMFLRAPLTTGHLWARAILSARDAALASGGGGSNSPPRSLASKRLSSAPASSMPVSEADDDGSPRAGAGAGAGAASTIVETPTNAAAALATKSSAPPAPVPIVVLPEASTAADVVPVETAFPLSRSPSTALYGAALVAFNAVAMAAYRTKPTAGGAPTREWALVGLWVACNVLVVLAFAQAKRRALLHNSLAKEARFMVTRLRQQYQNALVAQIQAQQAPLATAAALALAVGSTPAGASAAAATAAAAALDRSPSPPPPGMAPAAMVSRAAANASLSPGGIPPHMHVAGSSFKHAASPEETGAGKGMVWTQSKGESFNLRIGPNYKANGKKAPSAEPLYETVAMDLLRSPDAPLSNLAGSRRIVLPPPRPGIDDLDAIAKSGLPRLFVINAQVPDKAPAMFGGGKSAEVDPGYSLVFYFAVKPETVRAVLDGTASPALKLTKKYIAEHASNPDVRRRFKAIGMTDEASELGIPGMSALIAKFNGKPAIINKVASIFQGADWIEVDISIFDFPFMAKRGLYALKDRVPDLTLRAGFTVQGEDDDELPEILLGGADFWGLDFRCARVLPEPPSTAS